MKKLIMLGILDEEGYESDNRIYGRGGVSPTEKAGNMRIKVVRKYDKERGEKDNSIRRVGSK